MPGGRTHATATVIVFSLLVGPLAWYVFSGDVPVEFAFVILLGVFLTFWINPDLDLNRRFPRKQPDKWLWWIYWYPYSRAIPHRGKLSHSFILGTVIRFGYAFWTILAYLWYNSVEVHTWILVGLTLLGMTISDCLHILLDHTVKGHQ